MQAIPIRERATVVPIFNKRDGESKMFKKAIAGVIATVLSVAVVPAQADISPLQEVDYELLQGGASCWLQDDKEKIYLNDDMSNAVVRYKGKGIKLMHNSASFEEGMFACDTTYVYVSRDQKTRVTVKTGRAKNEFCVATLAVYQSGIGSVINGLTPLCGD